MLYAIYCNTYNKIYTPNVYTTGLHIFSEINARSLVLILVLISFLFICPDEVPYKILSTYILSTILDVLLLALGKCHV